MKKTVKRTTSVLLALLMLLTIFGGSLTSVAAAGNDVPANIVAQKQEDGSIQVNWDPVAGAKFYYIYMGNSDNGVYPSYTATYENNMREAKPPAGDRYYAVAAYVNGKLGPKSAPVKAAEIPAGKPAAEKSNLPSKPTGLAATVSETGSVHLTWAASEGALAYYVKRAEKGQTDYVDQTLTMGLSYNDTNVEQGKTYLYTIVAFGHFGESEASDPLEVQAAAPKANLPAPTNLTATVEDGEWVYLEWDAVQNADGYHISRSENMNGSYTQIDTVQDLYYEDFGVDEGKTYYYKVEAYNSSETGDEAGPVEAVVVKTLTLNVQTIDSETLYLNWTSVNNVASYEVHRASTQAGPYTTHATVYTESYYDRQLEPDTTYWYKIVAKAGDGTTLREIGPSSGKTALFTGDVLNVTATPQNSTSIRVAWSAAQDTDVDEYRVLRADSETGTYTQVGTTQGGTLQITDTGLNPGTTYWYKVVGVQTASGITKARGGPVSGTTVVDKPNVSATALSSSSIQVDWSAVTGATSYRVYRSTNANGPYTDLGVKTGQTFTDTGLQPNTTYYYKVAAIASNNAEGEQGGPASATTLIDVPTVYATAQGASSIFVNWTAVQGAQGYNVYRSTSANGTYTNIGYTTALYLIDGGLPSNTTYWYKVAAVTANNIEGEQGGPAQATTGMEKPDVYAIAQSSSQVVVFWTSVADANAYTIYRSTSPNGPYTNLGTTSTIGYFDNGLNSNVTYYYKVAAVSNGVTGPEGGPASATTLIDMPTVTAAAQSSSSILVNWSQVKDASGYYVYRSTSANGTYTNLGYKTGITFTDTGLQPNTTYYYKVAGFVNGTIGPQGGPASATTTVNAPTVTAVAQSSSSILVGWSQIQGASGYYVYRSTTANGTYTNLGMKTGTNFTDIGLNSGRTYYYKVAAVVSGVTGPQGGPANATTPIDKPTVSAVARSSSSIYVSWSQVKDASSYRVYRATSANGVYTDLGSKTGNNFTDTGLQPNTTYYYKVAGVVNSIIGPQGGPASAKTTIAAPTVTAVAQSSSSILVGWSQVTGATSYRVYRATSANGVYTDLGSKTGNNFTDTGLQPNTTYYYKVAGVVNGTIGPQGGPASAKTTIAAPTVTAVAQSSSSILVGWSQVTGATSYRVYRATSANGVYTDLGSKTGNNFTDTGLQANTTYYYKVAGVANGIIGPQGGPASATTKALEKLTVTVSTVSESSLRVNWTKPAGATSYTIYRSTYNGGYVQVATAGNVNTWTNTGLQSNTTYWYKVVANNGAEGVGSGKTSAAPVPVGPGAPPFYISMVSGDTMTFKWYYDGRYTSGYNGPVQPQYKIYIAESPNGPYKTMYTFNTGYNPTTGELYITLNGNYYQYSVGKSYYFKVAAINYLGQEGPKSRDYAHVICGRGQSQQPKLGSRNNLIW